MINIKASISVYDKGTKSRDSSKDFSGEFDLRELLEYTKKTLITTALEVLKEEQAKGFTEKPITTVDGRRGKPINSVSPLGSIAFTEKADLGLFALELYELLESRSPVDSGQYKRMNWVFYNRKFVASNLVELKSWITSTPSVKKGDTLIFINVAPYARFLERFGIRAGSRGIREVKSKDRKRRSGFDRTKINKDGSESTSRYIQGENGAYFLSWRAIRRKYRRNTKILFRLIPGRELGLDSIPAFDKKGRRLRRTYKKSGRSYLYPAIAFAADDQGFV